MFRARQQAMHEAAARDHAEKVKAKEEEKRAEKVKQLEALQNGQGYNNKSITQKKSTLRSDGKYFSALRKMPDFHCLWELLCQQALDTGNPWK